jgi:hypothetical protein
LAFGRLGSPPEPGNRHFPRAREGNPGTTKEITYSGATADTSISDVD